MGIPRLISHLQPYAVPAVLGCKASHCSEHNSSYPDDRIKVTIDGPGFAYHVFYTLLAHKSPSLSAFDAAPSYAEIGQRAITFLEELQLYGLTIEKIYFDGCLPERKEDVRISRLQSYTRELAAFRSLHSKGVVTIQQPATTAGRDLDNYGLFSNQPVPPRLRGLPASPFLVPAVLDALSNSQYASVTEVVAGEAEAYCARRVRHHGGIALTSDSDMLVYDLGAEGAVAFFKQLESRLSLPEEASLEACQLLVTKLFKPKDITQSLGLESLQRLAFEFKQGSYTKIRPAVQLSHQQPGDPAAFTYFLAEYVAKDEPDENAKVASLPSASIGYAECFADPRLSELLTSVSAFPNSVNMTMYLPFLIDDPSRVSAWAPSLGIRQLLYSCLHFLYPTSSRVHLITEYIRKGQVIGSTEISILSESDMEVIAERLVSIFHYCSAGNISWTSKEPWWAFAMILIMTWHEQEERAPPSKASCIRVCKGLVNAGVLTWDDIQLSAQIQGVLYSLRMLKQLLQKAAAQDVWSPSSLLEISSILRYLPNLADLMPSRLELVQSVGDFNVLDITDIAMGCMREASQNQSMSEVQTPKKPSDDGFETVSGKKRKKKASKKLQEGRGGSGSQNSTTETSDRGNNRFSFLTSA
ncbi:MAG: hypothetical protein Q9191_003531 [Dirinaria sp. TL-2023a]